MIWLNEAADIADNAATMVANWVEGLTTSYANHASVPAWGEWHSGQYDWYLAGSDLLILTPYPTSQVWVSKYHHGFIPDMRNNVTTMFERKHGERGRAYFVRPGRPRHVSIYRIPLTGSP